jgi:flagellar M-ring protein FliF
MNPVRQFAQQLINLYRQLSVGKRITLAALVLGTVAGLWILIAWTGNAEYRVLYTNLDPEDAGLVLAKLKERKIPYRIGEDGRSVLVPATQLYETRMELASQGLPQGGQVGFELFDTTKLGMSEFAQNVNFQRALQGELARTIDRFAEVESCRVHIVMPEKSLFVEKEEPASASVVLKLRPGRWLSQEQVNGIVHLVSSSVPRLGPENVTVVDSNGKMLAGFKDSSTFGSMSSDQLEYQERVERTLESRVKTMLEKALGADKAIVRLTCAFDFKRQEKTEELYLPENQVVRSEQLLNERSKTKDQTPQGIPGIRSNLPQGAKAPENTTVDQGNPSFEKSDRTVNYEIGKVTNHILEPLGEIKRISAAVMVDGTYRKAQAEHGGVKWEYVPRTAEEMAKLENIVKSAVNFDQARGDLVEVVNIPFETQNLAQDEETPIDTGWMVRLKMLAPYIQSVFLSLFLILSFLFIVRPLIRWLTEHTLGDRELLTQLPRPLSEIEHDYAGNVKHLPFRDQISDLIASDNEASLGVMRDWLQEK